MSSYTFKFEGNREPINQALIDAEIKAESTKLSPFDFLTSINEKKKMDFSDENTEKQYNPYMVNRGLSQSSDFVRYASLMDANYHLSKKMQFDFYYHIIPKNKKFNKWAKGELDKEDVIELIMKKYSYSKKRAAEVVSLFNEDAIKSLKMRLNEGGRI
jgi:hypothetical protein